MWSSAGPAALRMSISSGPALALGLALSAMPASILLAKDATPPAPAAAAPATPAASSATAAPPPSAAQPAPAAAPQPLSPAAEAAAKRKADIAVAKARCVATLLRLDMVWIPKDSIDEGECDILAPIELISVGKYPQVALSPPAIVNCEMAAAFHEWVKHDVQPLAKKHLGQPVSRIETMSSYSCRNAFGRKNGKLSEHGKANAIDVRGFVTVKGETAYVLENWGLTGFEIKALAAKAEEERKAREIAEARAKAEAEAKSQALAAAKPAGQSGAAAPAAGTNPLAAAGTLIEGLPKPDLSINGSTLGGNSRPTDFSMAPNRLGGPKPASAPKLFAAAPAPQPPQPAIPGAAKIDAKSVFLRELHAAACKRFMTTLGPESDKAHRNHYHIDLAERKVAKPICE